MGVTPWYATRESVKRALDVAETARADNQIDQALAGATRTIAGYMHRTFYPTQASRTFDWPNYQYAPYGKLWLEEDELISLTSVVSAGVTLSLANVFLRPDTTGPPFDRIELNRGTATTFGVTTTAQRSLTITGLFGYSNDEAPAGVVSGALSSSTTTVVVTSDAKYGVGDLIRVDNERMIITERAIVASGQTLANTMDAEQTTVAVAVADTSTFRAGMEIVIDGERMLITDVAGVFLIVKRGWSGSVMATHTIGAAVYANRQLTVVRGALGTTAATHSDGAAVARWLPPGELSALCRALAISTFQQERGGYAATGTEASANPMGQGVAAMWQSADYLRRAARMLAI